MENRRILLIDDDELTIEAVRKAFSGYEVELEVLRQPAGAFERVLEWHPRAIVLAVELPPQKQGYALCRRFKKTPETQTVPIVLISSGDPYFDDHKKLAMHADAYLLKPLAGPEVVQKLEAVSGPFERKKGAPPLPASAKPEVTAEIIEVDDEDLVLPEITVVGVDVSAVLEQLRAEDIRDPRRGSVPPPSAEPPRPSGSRASSAPRAATSSDPQRRGDFEPQQEDNNVFDAMLESLEFQAAPSRPGLGSPRPGAPPPLHTGVVGPTASTPAQADQTFAAASIPGAPSDPPLGQQPIPAQAPKPLQPIPSPAPATTPPPLVSPASTQDNPFAASAMTSGMFRDDEKRKDREMLDLRERLVVAERNATEQAELRAALHSELTAARRHASVAEAAPAASDQHLTEELAARDREISERTAQLERFSAEAEQRMEQSEASFAERMRRAREDHEAAIATLRQTAQRERAELESRRDEALRHAEIAHQKDLQAAKLASKTAAAEALLLRTELEPLRAQVATFDRERRELELTFAERLASATDEARRPLEEELGTSVERHALALAEHRKKLDAELTRAQQLATESLARSSGFESRLNEVEHSLFATMQRATRLDAEVTAANQSVAQAKAALAATETSLEARSRELESLRSELALREELVVKTNAKAAAAEEELRRAGELRASVDIEQARMRSEHAAWDALVSEARAKSSASETELTRARTEAARATALAEERTAELARAKEERDNITRRAREEAVGREGELARQREEAQRLREDGARTLANLESQSASLRESRATISALEERVLALEAQRREADAQQDSLRLRLEKLRGAFAALTSDLDDGPGGGEGSGKTKGG